jgi:hypothetical protein
MKARRSMSCMVSSPAPDQGALLIATIAARSVEETAAVFWSALSRH